MARRRLLRLNQPGRAPDVFTQALRDPVADIRRQAVHGLTCERCRSTDLCTDDVVPAVLEALSVEPDPEVRHQLVVVLGQFTSRSELANQTLALVTADDVDELLRVAAFAVQSTGHTRSRRALERLARGAARRGRKAAVASENVVR